MNGIRPKVEYFYTLHQLENITPVFDKYFCGSAGKPVFDFKSTV
jgi:hypothetical protein